MADEEKNEQSSAEVAEEKKVAEESGQGSAEDVAEAEVSVEEPAKAGKGKKRRMAPSSGVVHIKATFNNTQVSIADTKGNVVAWSSGGKVGFKGSRKSTAFAATIVCQDAARAAAAKGMREVEVKVQGAGSGRESAIRALQSVGMNVSSIKDVTGIPHNGCRPRKRRRV
ncbi:MAG: 30S ribosomal protein S11 [Verrucomicrobiota bacterium]